MIRIVITAAAYRAICATLPLGSVGYEAEAKERGESLIWLEDAMADRLGAMRGRASRPSLLVHVLDCLFERGGRNPKEAGIGQAELEDQEDREGDR